MKKNGKITATLRHGRLRTAMRSTLVILLVFQTLFGKLGFAYSDNELGSWSTMLYYGATGKETFGQILGGRYSQAGENLYALEAAYTLAQENPFRRLFAPVFDTVQLATNVTYRQDYAHHDRIYEGNLYVIWRFSRFPWSDVLHNSVAFGDGISYASHVPAADMEESKQRGEYSKLLNYMIVEATFALPDYPKIQLALRLHHKCTAWGTFPKRANAGSTSVCLGLRFYLE